MVGGEIVFGNSKGETEVIEAQSIHVVSFVSSSLDKDSRARSLRERDAPI
jgi:hypothetical protein